MLLLGYLAIVRYKRLISVRKIKIRPIWSKSQEPQDSCSDSHSSYKVKIKYISKTTNLVKMVSNFNQPVRNICSMCEAINIKCLGKVCTVFSFSCFPLGFRCHMVKNLCLLVCKGTVLREKNIVDSNILFLKLKCY